MLIKFDVKRLEEISDKGGYNHHYYKLPYSIDGCDILYIEWIEDAHEGDYYLGNFINEEFEPKHLFYGDRDGRVDLLYNKIMSYY